VDNFHLSSNKNQKSIDKIKKRRREDTHYHTITNQEEMTKKKSSSELQRELDQYRSEHSGVLQRAKCAYKEADRARKFFKKYKDKASSHIDYDLYKRMANRPKDLIAIHKKIMNLESKIRKKRKQESLAVSQQSSTSDADAADMPTENRNRGRVEQEVQQRNEANDYEYEQVVRRAQQQRYVENSRNFSEASLRSRGLEICTRSGHLILSRDERMKIK